MKVGIVGCGTIGSEIAVAISKGEIPGYSLAGLYDNNENQIAKLLPLIKKTEVFKNLIELINKSDLVFEATQKSFMPLVVEKALLAKKKVLAMSVGGIVERPDLLSLAERQQAHLFFPSGAMCGIDGILAGNESNLNKIQITSTKHPRSLMNAPYVIKNKISLENLDKPKIIFEGTAAEAINEFPANVNVSITLSLASLGIERTIVRIIADPNCQKTRQEIFAEGDFGSIMTVTEGVASPSNPSTGYLAILSAKATLRRINSMVHVGT